MPVRTPSDDVAPSYEGPTELAVCGYDDCRRVAYVPVWDMGLPQEGFCTGCERITTWRA